MRAYGTTIGGGGERFGFTIVELLVVIGIISVLIGMLLPALGAARARGNKVQEMNALRQVGYAWNLYSNQHNGALLPGYLDLNETEWDAHWGAQHEYPMWDPEGDSLLDLPESRIIEPSIAGPWPWRLMEYLDYDYDTLLRYRNDDTTTMQALVERREVVASEPAFGYNAYYAGGWLEMVTVSTPDGGNIERIRPRFWDAKDVETGERVNVVARTQSSIRRPSNFIAFSSSSRFDEVTSFRNVDDNRQGSHLVTPPILAEEPQWGFSPPGAIAPMQAGGAGMSPAVEAGQHDLSSIHTYVEPAHVPIGRYNRRVVIMRADGSVDEMTHMPLFDQRLWINGVNDRNFQHTED